MQKNIINIFNVFYIKKLDIFKFNTSNITKMNLMFVHYNTLKSLD